MNEQTRSMLLELADFLNTLPEERFRYSSWVGSDWQGDPNLSCGTTACAAGWATTLPSYKKRGLFLNEDVNEVALRDKKGALVTTDGVEAMAEVLDISEADANFLFIPEQYDEDRYIWSPRYDASAAEVAAHIRNYVRVILDNE